MQEVENAKEIYHRLKGLGYISSPSELFVSSAWVSERHYFEPRMEKIDLGGYTHLTLVEHPNGTCSYAIHAQYMGHNLYQLLTKEYANSRLEAIDKAKEILLPWCECAHVPQEWVSLIKANFERIGKQR